MTYFVQVAHVAQWLKRRRKDLMILKLSRAFESHCESRVPVFRMKPYKPRLCVAVGVARKRTLTAKSHECY
jgi:hypothetical protein